MKSPLFIGSAVAIITPFNDNGVDYDTLGDLVEFQIKNSTDAMKNMLRWLSLLLTR